MFEEILKKIILWIDINKFYYEFKIDDSEIESIYNEENDLNNVNIIDDFNNIYIQSFDYYYNNFSWLDNSLSSYDISDIKFDFDNELKIYSEKNTKISIILYFNHFDWNIEDVEIEIID